MYFNTVPHQQVLPYWNNYEWQGNYSNPSVHSNFSNDFSLDQNSYQNPGTWNSQPSPSYGYTSKLDETLAKFLQASSGYQDQHAQETQDWKYEGDPFCNQSYVERASRLEDTLEKYVQMTRANLECSAKKSSEGNQQPFLANTTPNPKEQCIAMERKSADLTKNEQRYFSYNEWLKAQSGYTFYDSGYLVRSLEVSGIDLEDDDDAVSEVEEREIEKNIELDVEEEEIESEEKEKERKEKEEEDLRPISAPMPTLHSDVTSQEAKTNEEVHLIVLPPLFDDAKPSVMKSDVNNNDEVATSFFDYLKLFWPSGGNPLNKHFGGGLKLEGRRYSSLACLKPP